MQSLRKIPLARARFSTGPKHCAPAVASKLTVRLSPAGMLRTLKVMVWPTTLSTVKSPLTALL
jgi:hypothetical protein